MVVDLIFDSLCRCFGAPGSQTPQPAQDGSILNKASTARRSDLVQLKDKQFDALFVNGKSAKVSTTRQYHNNPDIEQAAQAVAKAKLAAARQKKRKSPVTRRDEIFRSRGFEHREKPEPATNSFSRFLSSNTVVANALCFATPIEDDLEPNDILKVESDCATLNTCEDTVTSTLFFERKYAHIVEHRPPMPLFNQFKVDTKESDELLKIVASDSHNSLKMIRLMNETAQANMNSKMLLEESEEEEDEPTPLTDDDVPQVVKIDSSCSSASSRR